MSSSSLSCEEDEDKVSGEVYLEAKETKILVLQYDEFKIFFLNKLTYQF